MIKMYVMQTCPDCEYVEKQVEGNPNFEVIEGRWAGAKATGRRCCM